MYKEQQEAMERVDGQFRKQEWSEDTGLPDAAFLLPPVDASPEELAEIERARNRI